MPNLKRYAKQYLLVFLLASSSAHADTVMGYASVVGLGDTGNAKIDGALTANGTITTGSGLLTIGSGGIVSTTGTNTFGVVTITAPAAGDNSNKAVTSAFVNALLGANGYATAPTANGSLTPTSYTQPTSGTAPTGLSQISTSVTIIPSSTAAPANGQVNAGQLVLPPGVGYGRIISNQSNYAFYVYPPSSGTLSLQAANVPIYISPGFIGNLQWFGGNVWSVFVGANFSWLDAIVVTIPANIGAGTCTVTAATEARSRLGDRVFMTDTTSVALLNNNVGQSGVIGTGTAGSLSLKLCNVSTLATSGAQATPTLGVMGFGGI